MPPQIATVLFAVGIAGLFWLDRDSSARTSKALWLPVIWLWLSGSRPPSAWLGMNMTEIPGQPPPTSTLDELLAASLMLLGVMVMLRRRRDLMVMLRASWPIVLYFAYCLLSLIGSDYPAWGLKRWVRALGDVIMVLVVVTDAQPTAALRRLLSRVGFVLLPASVLLIRYYPWIGQGFDPWGGSRAFLGVTTNKNILGVLVQVVTLGTLWQVIVLLRDKTQPKRKRRLLAQGILLYFGLSLLMTAHSATCEACFALGAGLMLLIARPFFAARPAAVHALVLTMVLAGGLTLLFGGQAEVAESLGRDPSLTGRTELWKQVIPMAPNMISGAGFETFWVGPRVARFYAMRGGLNMTNEAHNGYIEVYLNLGWLGVCLIALILVHGYRKAARAFRRDPALGALLLAYIVTAAIYNITEAGFRMLGLPWLFLLLAIVAASRIISLGRTAPESDRESDRPPGSPGVLDLDDWTGLGDPRAIEKTAALRRTAIRGTREGIVARKGILTVQVG